MSVHDERNYDGHSKLYLIEQLESARQRIKEQSETIELFEAMKVGFTVRAADYEKRIRELEESLDTLTLVVGLTPIAGNKEALQEAIDHSRKLIAQAAGRV